MSETTETAASQEVPAGERVTVEVSDHVAEVRMVRADKHNALDWAMFKALESAAAELAERREVRAVVLSGEGPSFCSGLDFPSFIEAGMPVENMLARREGDVANVAQAVSLDWQRLPVPVIAALHGAAYGGGAQIALGADIRIAAADLRFSILEIKWGLIPDMGLTRTLPRLVSIDVAKELAFTGRIVEASEARDLGLVTRLADDPRAAALELAHEIAGRSPHAIRSGKRLLNETWVGSEAETLALEAELQGALLGSENQIAAITAAMTKQPAEFGDPD
jgi:enoyl-CoA hydratase/carnithine racemase